MRVHSVRENKKSQTILVSWLFDGAGGFHRPRVFVNEPWYFSKEVHFFDNESRYRQGEEFYEKRFEDARTTTGQANGSHAWAMDAMPNTLQFPEKARATYEAAGGKQDKTVKILVILCDPVARELSLYNHLAYDCRNLDRSASGSPPPLSLI